MTTIKFPPFLEVEEEEEFDPADRYGEPTKVTITVKFGEFVVARYDLVEAYKYSGFYYDDADGNRRILYDTPEEFLAEKLKKLFKLLD
jgi:hypothetical protein